MDTSAADSEQAASADKTYRKYAKKQKAPSCYPDDKVFPRLRKQFDFQVIFHFQSPLFLI
jgi:hypothetical protein